MKFRSSTRVRLYVIWFVLLLLQSAYTELMADEAYYWMYSQKLAWGYFDHPPMIAAMITLGRSLLGGTLGVRFVTVLGSLGTMYIVERIISPSSFRLYFALYVSVALLHFMGFFALPDGPLLFFTALFLWGFKRFLEQQSLILSVGLGLVIALMCLSKYHALIIMLLVLVANFRLLRSGYFWFMGLVGILCLWPHLYWQISHEFPSIKYHLVDRSSTPWHTGMTLEYLATIPFTLGPFAGILFFISVYKSEVQNDFEKTLQYIFWGGYIFFFLMSFRGGIEAHWTLFTVLPALYFGYKYLYKNLSKIPYWKKLAVISVILILSARLLISQLVSLGAIPVLTPLLRGFHSSVQMEAIADNAQSRDVVFLNSYQKASLYNYYGSTESFSLHTVRQRASQYDVWNSEELFRGRDVLLMPNYKYDVFDTMLVQGELLYSHPVDNFQSYSAIKIKPYKLPAEIKAGDSVRVILKFELPDWATFSLESNLQTPSYLSAIWYKGDKNVGHQIFDKLRDRDLKGSVFVELAAPDTQGDCTLYFSVETGMMSPTSNSAPYDIKVK